ncbi:Citrate synthase [Rasamsonia emersonii CBS 393.64]|uniref:Citrate synthase n=1 Tax=Rasamsonia emersonii (strain ATCC 16479 / CBS 393.64 / IMI 116815) TaxID=1408163 RepID=A0A0F4YSK5_RASE3|nr:Citrate synthase [Rasamsonia emersonii CBS 393.64]KKA21090.1 Citrate synthase [Rasamsonia emersonii CBS 393.64]
MLDILVQTFRRWKKLLYSYLTSAILFYHKALGHTAIGPSSGSLSITDNRTRRKYTIPIVNNAIRATDFLQITSAGMGADFVDHYENSIRILDKGFLNTACTESAITLIDGKRGYIQYRDYSIEDLFHHHDYEEVIHLLIWGKLPTPEQKNTLRRKLAAAMKPYPNVINVIQSFPPDSLTFPMILAGIAAYASLDEGTRATHSQSQPYYLGKDEAVDAAVIRTLATLATITALVYCHKRGRKFTPANPDESYIGNILLMMGVIDEGTGQPNRKIEHCFERLWILNADHGMTNSTAAFLSAASTLTDPLSCSIAAVASAYGPLHGAAVEIAYRVFENVGTVENVPKLIADVKAKKFRLFGYGHRIYKVVDPRGKLVRQLIDEYREDVRKNPLLQVALEIDRIAGEDHYFTSRNLKANADLYGCFLYTALGFETDIILALSCLSRSPGVLAHWRESMSRSISSLHIVIC